MSEKADIYQMTLWGIHELQQDGFSRSMSYKILNRSDMPIVKIGNRRYIHRELFQKWLEDQASGKMLED